MKPEPMSASIHLDIDIEHLIEPVVRGLLGDTHWEQQDYNPEGIRHSITSALQWGFETYPNLRLCDRGFVVYYGRIDDEFVTGLTAGFNGFREHFESDAEWHQHLLLPQRIELRGAYTCCFYNHGDDDDE